MSSTKNSLTMTMDDSVSWISSMRAQEESGYRCEDYLSRQPKVTDEEELKGWSAPIDADCRFKMAEWCYQIVDLCKLKRETVAIALSYLDRYVSTTAGERALKSRKIYQLASMSCLYIATKLHEPLAMDPAMVSHLSRRNYSEKQVINMELSILEALRWRVNPPTALAFVRCFITLVPGLTEETRKTTFDIARYQTELAVNKYEFVPVRASTIAFASIANALELIEYSEAIRIDSLRRISKIASLEMSSLKSKEVGKMLFHAILNSALTAKAKRDLMPPNIKELIKTVDADASEPASSPRSVARNHST